MPVLRASESTMRTMRASAIRANFTTSHIARLSDLTVRSEPPDSACAGLKNEFGRNNFENGTTCVMTSATTAVERNTEFSVNALPN